MINMLIIYTDLQNILKKCIPLFIFDNNIQIFFVINKLKLVYVFYSKFPLCMHGSFSYFVI